MAEFKFHLKHKDHQARTGFITTKHGLIQTPAFMPVGTAATVKGVFQDDIKIIGADIILANTYHLMLRPGADLIEKFGGVRKFMNWQGPLLTDSGGYQVMSLSDLRKITENGVRFRSHIDGSYHDLTPEYSTEIQHKLDATITMAFDECTPFPASWAMAKKSMELSMRWANRSRKAFCEREGYGQFGIVQGGIYQDLRAQSAKSLQDIGFEGYAIGGLAVGEGQRLMFATLNETVPLLAENKPRYLMGVGTPDDLIGAVMRGIDMFDCVMPTRSGRNGQAFTRYGKVNMRNAKHALDGAPLDDLCGCLACQNHSKAYLHHLIKSGEMLGPMLLTLHNLYHYQKLMRLIRLHIQNQTIALFASQHSFNKQLWQGNNH